MLFFKKNIEFDLFWVLSIFNIHYFLSLTSCNLPIECPDTENNHFEVSFICKNSKHVFVEAFVNGKPLYLIICLVRNSRSSADIDVHGWAGRSDGLRSCGVIHVLCSAGFLFTSET